MLLCRGLLSPHLFPERLLLHIYGRACMARSSTAGCGQFARFHIGLVATLPVHVYVMSSARACSVGLGGCRVFKRGMMCCEDCAEGVPSS